MENNLQISAPAISVIMGVYNCAGTLPEALDSLLAQTETDWELILCDDGSTDGTRAVAEGYRLRYPERITLLENRENLGLAASLNRCFRAARGRYIARMDGDDCCTPERLAAEREALDREPALAVVSTDLACFDEHGLWGVISHPKRPEARDFLRGTPFCHGPAMVRREALEAVGGYCEDRRFLRVEDYALWVRLYGAGFTGRNLHRTLYYAREDREAHQRRRLRYRINEARVRCLAVQTLGLPAWGCLPKWGYVSAARPLLVGLLPGPLYRLLHRKRLGAVRRRKGE